MSFRTLVFRKLKILFQLILIGLVFFAVVFFVFILWTKYAVHKENVNTDPLDTNEEISFSSVQSFPIGVDPEKKEIIEDPLFSTYIESHLLVTNTSKQRQAHLFDRIVAKLAESNLYQQLASPRSRILVIFPGERKEEITKNFGDILRWNNEQRKTFTNEITKAEPLLEEGKFFPGRYVVDSKITPEEVAKLVNNRFITEILSKYNTEVSHKVPLEDARTIASLLEREAYDFTDMRQISGIIWNRLFIDMPLQLDASLQYVRGGKNYETKWWPTPKPADKFLNSPYNTYKNKGLPPTPIANPSVEAIVATLNPEITDCMFYFHDKKGGFRCTKTYEEHVALLRQVYGRGK